MRRAAFAWGGAAAAILTLGTLSAAAVVAQNRSAEAHVTHYLDALARDDLNSAARLAGLPSTAHLPLGDEGTPSIHRVVSTTAERNGTATVLIEYGSESDAERVAFTMTPAPPLLGVISTWAFATAPVATLTVGADQHDSVTVGERSVTSVGAGNTVAVAVFVPSRVTVRLSEPLLRAEAVTLRVTKAIVEPVVLMAQPSPQLERSVRQQLDRLLTECATQRVLRPATCPFGAEIIDRVVGEPQWQISQQPGVTLAPGETPGRWQLSGDGVARLSLTVQQLFDGSIGDRVELIPFTVRGEIVLGADGGVLTVYPPDD